MIKFYYNLAPNPMKVALFLEESGLPYEAIPIDSRKGEQFSAALTALNPNNKVPVIQDGEVTVFDSNAILLYLAEKTGTFLPEQTPGTAVLADVRRDRHRPLFGTGGAFPPFRARAQGICRRPL
jgi:GST-like protein